VFTAAALVMLLVTQTRERVEWPAWLVPMAFGVVITGLTGYAWYTEGPDGLWQMIGGSAWGLQFLSDRLMSTAAAFFLLQNRARAAGMKSETWVLVVIFTGSIGLLFMLARTVYLERNGDLLTN
jgi:hypothetical protein